MIFPKASTYSFIIAVFLFSSYSANAYQLPGCYKSTEIIFIKRGEKQISPLSCTRLYTDDQYVNQCSVGDKSGKVVNFLYKIEKPGINAGIYEAYLTDSTGNKVGGPASTKFYSTSNDLKISTTDGDLTRIYDFARVELSVCNEIAKSVLPMANSTAGGQVGNTVAQNPVALGTPPTTGQSNGTAVARGRASIAWAHKCTYIHNTGAVIGEVPREYNFLDERQVRSDLEDVLSRYDSRGCTGVKAYIVPQGALSTLKEVKGDASCLDFQLTFATIGFLMKSDAEELYNRSGIGCMRKRSIPHAILLRGIAAESDYLNTVVDDRRIQDRINVEQAVKQAQAGAAAAQARTEGENLKAAVARRQAAKTNSPKMIGERVFTADQVRSSVSPGGDCRPWIRGTPSFHPNWEESFFHTIEVLPGVSASEIGGGVAMVTPKSGKIYPVKLVYTDYLSTGDKTGWVKGYMFKDNFGDVRCILG